MLDLEAAYYDSIPCLFMRREGYNLRVTKLIPVDMVNLVPDDYDRPCALIHPETLNKPQDLRAIVIANWPSCPDCSKP